MEKQQQLSINVLGEGFVVDGVRVTIPTQCVISGTILQHVECLGKLILNRSAVIRGNIKAADLVLKGSYEGSIWVKGVVTLTSTSRFRGEISASRLIVEEGAYCNMDIQVDTDASDRFETALLEEETSRFTNQKSELADVDSTMDDVLEPEEGNLPDAQKKRRKQKRGTSEEVTDEIEMDRSDAPGKKVADHFW